MAAAAEAARGWLDVAKQVKKQIKRDRLSIVAAGVAFYGLLAVFPGLVALVGFYGLLVEPAQVEQHVSAISHMLPPQAAELLLGQLHDLATTDRAALGAGAIAGLLLAALILTFGGVIAVVLAIALVVGVPAFLKLIRLGGILETVLSFVRWPVLALLAILGFAALYRYGPSRAKPRWRWVTWGAAIAVALWIIGSALFSVYVTRFGNYNETYGAAGAVVILLMWFLLSSYAVLIGAEINGATERQTRKDTTSGRDRPMGARRAYAADTVGEGST